MRAWLLAAVVGVGITTLAISRLAAAQGAGAEVTRVAYLKPQYLPPAELTRILGVHERNGRDVMEWRSGEQMRSVEVRRNDSANLVMLAGAPDDVAAVEAMMKAADVPPRQIMVEAKIVEVDKNRAFDLGVDWSRIRGDAFVTQDRSKEVQKRSSSQPPFPPSSIRDEITLDRLRVGGAATLFDVLRLLEEAGAATFRDAPRILTLNNRRATILDGQRVTYVTRYSSYTNLFETDTLDAGLTLSLLPSVGESGYLTLDIRAELTSVTGNISGSPVKDGQIVENTVIVKDGETVLLGGFLRTAEVRTRRRFPLLGYVVPFLFSREISTRTSRESFVALTPRVVDLAATMDAKSRGVIEGK